MEHRHSDTELPEVDEPEKGEKGWGTTKQAHLKDDSSYKEKLSEKMKQANDRFNRGEKVAITLEEKVKQMNVPADSNPSVKKNQREGESKAYEWWSEERCIKK